MASLDDNELALKLFKRADKLKSYRNSIFDPRWQEISDYFWPDVSDINTEKTESTTGWFDRLYESTAMRASATCSVGVRNWVTPSTEPWLDLAPPTNLTKNAMARQPDMSQPGSARVQKLLNPQSQPVDENGVDEATRWSADTAQTILQELAASNFYSVVQPFNRSACVFGTALMFMEEGKANLYRFEQFKVGTFVICENDEKTIDTVVRWFKLTIRQAAQKFGIENLPKKMQEAFDKKKYDEMYEFMHHVFPNDDFKVGELGTNGKAFASVYQTVVEKKIVSYQGYDEMPYFCLRWSRWGTDDQAYGCSPAFETLVEARQLNFVTQYQDALAELKAFPRLLYPDNLDGNIQLAAGGVTTYKADQPEAVPREWLTQGDYQNTKEMLDDKRDALKKAFFVDIFNALGNLEDKRMTATEVSQRIGEKLDQFTGTFDQYRTDLINPLILRCIGIAYRANKLGKAPEALMVRPNNDPKEPMQLATPKINIKSRVTLAMNEVKNVGTEKTLGMLQPLAQMRPEIMDNFNFDNLVRMTGRNFGMPEASFRSMKEVVDLRNQRAQMIAKENALKNAETAANAAGKLGKAPQQLQDAASNQLQSAQG